MCTPFKVSRGSVSGRVFDEFVQASDTWYRKFGCSKTLLTFSGVHLAAHAAIPTMDTIPLYFDMVLQGEVRLRARCCVCRC